MSPNRQDNPPQARSTGTPATATKCVPQAPCAYHGGICRAQSRGSSTRTPSPRRGCTQSPASGGSGTRTSAWCRAPPGGGRLRRRPANGRDPASVSTGKGAGRRSAPAPLERRGGREACCHIPWRGGGARCCRWRDRWIPRTPLPGPPPATNRRRREAQKGDQKGDQLGVAHDAHLLSGRAFDFAHVVYVDKICNFLVLHRECTMSMSRALCSSRFATPALCSRPLVVFPLFEVQMQTAHCWWR